MLTSLYNCIRKLGFSSRMILAIAMFCIPFGLIAQGKNNIKLTVETGPVLLPQDAENLSFFFNLETKIKAFEKAYLGLRFGVTVNSDQHEVFNVFEFFIDDEFDNGIISFVPVFDYYLSERNLRPYLGVGVAFHISPDPVEIFRIGAPDPSEDFLELGIDNRIGLLFRGGVESGKFRFGLEYNLIPKADLELPDRPPIGRISNSYLGLSIGFLILGRNKQRE